MNLFDDTSDQEWDDQIALTYKESFGTIAVDRLLCDPPYRKKFLAEVFVNLNQKHSDYTEYKVLRQLLALRKRGKVKMVV